MNSLWEITCEECGASDKAYFSPKDVKIYLLNINNYPTAITIMPPPIIHTDAYIAAAVLITNEINDKSELEQTVAFITLERAIGPYGIETYFLCAWNGPTHINLGIVLETPNPSEFVDAVEYVLKEHMEKLIGANEAKKWDGIHHDIGRNFASVGITGNA